MNSAGLDFGAHDLRLYTSIESRHVLCCAVIYPPHTDNLMAAPLQFNLGLHALVQVRVVSVRCTLVRPQNLAGLTRDYPAFCLLLMTQAEKRMQGNLTDLHLDPWISIPSFVRAPYHVYMYVIRNHGIVRTQLPAFYRSSD